jgi:hypothetical protein
MPSKPCRLGARPKVEIGIEIVQRTGRIEALVKFAWRSKEFEDPRLDHVALPISPAAV